MTILRSTLDKMGLSDYRVEGSGYNINPSSEPVSEAVGGLTKDTPVGGLMGQESSAEEAGNIQRGALSDAQQFQEAMYQEAKDQLSPYAEMGSTWMGNLERGIQEGQFIPEEFSYKGAPTTTPSLSHYDPVSGVDYQGQQVDPFSYVGTGQQGALDYQGRPVDRSIASYMQSDPSLAWQQEQMEKAINRQGAARGRWGGGATAREMMRETSGLLSQDYANRFARAQAERGAQVGAEQDRYGRSLTDLALQNQAEQAMYGRARDEYGLDTAREQEAYQRALTGSEWERQAEQERHGRRIQDFQIKKAAEQERYDRAFRGYGMEQERLQNQLAQYQGLANLGPQMAQSMANAALGQGSALSNLAIQQGNVAAAAKMADSNQLGRLLELGGQAAQLYGAAG